MIQPEHTLLVSQFFKKKRSCVFGLPFNDPLSENDGSGSNVVAKTEEHRASNRTRPAFSGLLQHSDDNEIKRLQLRTIILKRDLAHLMEDQMPPFSGCIFGSA